MQLDQTVVTSSSLNTFYCKRQCIQEMRSNCRAENVNCCLNLLAKALLTFYNPVAANFKALPVLHKPCNMWRENGGKFWRKKTILLGEENKFLRKKTIAGGSCPPSALICTQTTPSISWLIRHGSSAEGVVGATFTEVHSRIFHPVLQIDNGEPGNGVTAFHHAISLLLKLHDTAST